jgi:hypothetical protein
VADGTAPTPRWKSSWYFHPAATGVAPADESGARANDVHVPANVDIVPTNLASCPMARIPFLPRACQNLHGICDKTDLDLALGRQFPAFRRVVVNGSYRWCRERTPCSPSRLLPTLFRHDPGPLGLWRFASDTAFLTVNQVHGSDIGRVRPEVGLGKQKGGNVDCGGSWPERAGPRT